MSAPMFACVVRKPDGRAEFTFVMANAEGQPIIPEDHTVLSITPWSTAVEKPAAEFSLSCAGRTSEDRTVSRR